MNAANAFRRLGTSRVRLLRTAGVFAGLFATLSGCVDRRYVVTTDPPGATVLRNYERIGASPADDHFVYYGKYHFTLIHDGYQTIQVDQPIRAPWYEYPPFDFFAESLWPGTIHDIRRFHYQMQPVQKVQTSELIGSAEGLRQRGQAIAPPVPPAAGGAGSPVPAGSPGTPGAAGTAGTPDGTSPQPEPVEPSPDAPVILPGVPGTPGMTIPLVGGASSADAPAGGATPPAALMPPATDR